MTRPRLALAGAITVLLLVGGGRVAIQSSAAPATLAFVAGAGAAAATPVLAAPPPPGPLALPLSNPTQLEPALAALGYRLPPGAHVYAAKVGKDASGLTYDDYQTGGGALAADFWPASSLKVLAAVGALEFVGKQGFTGAAMVTFGRGAPQTLRSVYDAAIRVSSNGDYDRLVELAGIEWLNKEFLTAARGFPVTVIQKSYTVGGNVRSTVPITLTEGGRKVTLPPRPGRVAECPQVNCSNLFEMSESIRRVVLHNELPPADRFQISPADAAGLSSALLGAEGWFEPAVAKVLGPTARIYGKPGQVPGNDCLDVTLIEWRNQRLLLSATVPESQGGCPALVALVTNVLKVLTA